MDKQILFENLSRLALALEKQFGPDCEVVVHDLSRPENSIVCIAGNVTGRRIGGPLTDFVLGLLENDEHPDDTIGYSARTGDGRTLKSSTIFINDEKGRPGKPLRPRDWRFWAKATLTQRLAAPSLL